jgi:hypothetical protein
MYNMASVSGLPARRAAPKKEKVQKNCAIKKIPLQKRHTRRQPSV